MTIRLEWHNRIVTVDEELVCHRLDEDIPLVPIAEPPLLEVDVHSTKEDIFGLDTEHLRILLGITTYEVSSAPLR